MNKEETERTEENLQFTVFSRGRDQTDPVDTDKHDTENF